MALESYAKILADAAERDPDRPALTSEQGTVTRRELDQLATRIARTLAAVLGGARKGARPVTLTS